MFTVYLLSQKNQGVAKYVGITNNFPRRMKNHKYAIRGKSKNKRTEPVNIWKLEVGWENIEATIHSTHPTKIEAMKVEQHIIETLTHISLGGTNVHRKQ